MTICAEAALKIRELESQVAFLAADREQWKRQALATNITMRTLLEAKAEVARLHQALDDFGKHTDRCAVRYKWERDCICGLTAARQRTPDTATGKVE